MRQCSQTPSWISGVSFQVEGKGRMGRKRGKKSPKSLTQKFGSTANAAVNR